MLAEEPIHFALLVPMTSAGMVQWGPKIIGSAALAVTRVNADPTLLPGRVLQFSWADSGCSPQQALAAMGKMLRGERTISAVIGPGCSSACEATSSVLPKIPQISYSWYENIDACGCWVRLWLLQLVAGSL